LLIEIKTLIIVISLRQKSEETVKNDKISYEIKFFTSSFID